MVGVVVIGVAVAGVELSGAPTAISQRCPGCPCGGFIPDAVAVAGAVVAFTGVVDGEVPLSLVSVTGSDVTGSAVMVFWIIESDEAAASLFSFVLPQANRKQEMVNKAKLFFMLIVLRGKCTQSVQRSRKIRKATVPVHGH
jgi:hypothetical protein